MFFIFVKYLESNIIAGSIPNIKKCFINESSVGIFLILIIIIASKYKNIKVYI
jgi:hypothetical protein